MTITVRNNDDGSLDEVVGFGAFHLEQMSDRHWWLQVEDAVTGKTYAINLATKRAKISALCEVDDPGTREAGIATPGTITANYDSMGVEAMGSIIPP